MSVLLGLLAGVTIFLLLGPGSHPKRASPLARLYAKLGAPSPILVSSGTSPPWIRRLPLRPVVSLIRPLLSPRYKERIERWLRVSRLAHSHTYDDILAMKVGMALACWFYVGLVMLKRPDPLLGGLLGSMGLLGFTVPDGWLRRKARLRQDQIRKELPAVLSAVAVALEAGLHLMSAISEAAQGRKGVLAEELRQAVDLYERGETPAEALERVAKELEVTELTMVLASLLQAFSKGSGQVVRTVRAQAAEAWQKRRRRAEALAQTASVKLFLPLALLALPGFLIFLLGPAVLEIIGYVTR